MTVNEAIAALQAKVAEDAEFGEFIMGACECDCYGGTNRLPAKSIEVHDWRWDSWNGKGFDLHKGKLVFFDD